MFEQRIISFTEAEAASALAEYRKSAGYDPIAFDDLKVCDYKEEVVIECWDRLRATTHRYWDHDICSALMLFCMKNRVPLPKRGSKSVYLTQGQIKLVVTLQTATQVKPAL